MKVSFSEVFEDCTRLVTKIKTDEYRSSGKYAIIDQGQNVIAGYTDRTDGVYCDVPAIIFGDHTRSIKYVDTPFFLGADGVKLLKSKVVGANYKYLYYVLQSIRIPNTGYNRHFKWLKESKFEYPDLEKQSHIAAVLDKVTDIITQSERQLELLDELVKARFVEMFGDVIQNNKNWTSSSLSDIATSRLGKMLDSSKNTGKNSFPYLANFNVQWFRFDLEKLNQMDFNQAEQAEFELLDGDLLVCEGGEIGRCAIWHNQVKNCYFQKAIHRVRCNPQKILPEYLAYWFKYNCGHNGFAAIEGAKATISHLPGVKLKALIVAVPPLKLQQEFADFVEQSDKSKSQIAKSLEQLETLKKALMQQYFG